MVLSEGCCPVQKPVLYLDVSCSCFVRRLLSLNVHLTERAPFSASASHLWGRLLLFERGSWCFEFSSNYFGRYCMLWLFGSNRLKLHSFRSLQRSSICQTCSFSLSYRNSLGMKMPCRESILISVCVRGFLLCLINPDSSRADGHLCARRQNSLIGFSECSCGFPINALYL